MEINFNNSLWLILAPFAIGFIVFVAKDNNSFKKKFLTILRSVISMVLILAIAGTSIKTYTDITTTIFAVDISKSIDEAKTTSQQFISDAIKHQTENDLAGVIAFGSNTALEVSPAKEIALQGFKGYINPQGTNIEGALKTASSLIESNSEKRIVLITDGNETMGNALNQVPTLIAQNIVIDGVYLENTIEEEVQLTSIKTPSYMNKNTLYDIEVTADSLTNTQGTLKIYKGNTLTFNQEIDLRKGKNTFLFSDNSSQGGGIIYRAEIESTTDTLYENNKAYSYTYVEDIPSILVVENANNSGSEIVKILESSRLNVSLVKPSQVPKTLGELNLYDGVILADVSATQLDQGFLNALEAFIRLTGGGLLAIGGENSYALGGYSSTVLEDILPVSMQLESEGEKPDLSMIMVIDRSGSMTEANYGVSRIDMAKEAAMRAVEIMEPSDTVGVIAFDTIPNWAVSLQKIGENNNSIMKSIGSIQAGGGTSILPALKQAYDEIIKTDTKLKHIILLTDGQAEQTGYDSLIEQMKANGITLSTIAVGGGADTKLLSDLAQKANGRYYFTSEFSSLPEIFTKETTLAGKEYLNNREFYPVGSNSPILTGIEQIAPLKGYVGTTIKPRGDMVLKSDTDQPILATWQYGIGRTSAWTSDLTGQWSSKWLNSQEGVAIIRNTVSWLMGSNISQEITFDATKNGDFTTLKATMPYNSKVKAVTGTIVDNNNKETGATFKAISPEVYESELSNLEEGSYIIALFLEMEDGTTDVKRGGFSIQYPVEYDLRLFANGKEGLEKLISATGGKIIANPQEVFSQQSRNVYTDKSLTLPFIIVALLLFLMDIAFRRFTLISSKAETLLTHRPKKTNQPKPVPTQPATTQKAVAQNAPPQPAPPQSTTAQLLKSKNNRNIRP